MIKTLLLALLFFTGNYKPAEISGTELLKKTITYHDAKNNWSKLKAKLYLSSTNSEGKENNYELELDNKKGYYCHTSRQDGKEIVKGYANGKEFFLLNGQKNFSEEDRKKYKLTSESLKNGRNYYAYLYGLPMRLTDAGAMVSNQVMNEEVDGKTYPTIRVSYEPAVGKDNWFFYCDAQTFALKAYRFKHGSPDSGEYILLDQEVIVDGVILPKIRKWYLNKDNKYLGTDNIIKAEKLTGYRN